MRGRRRRREAIGVAATVLRAAPFPSSSRVPLAVNFSLHPLADCRRLLRPLPTRSIIVFFARIQIAGTTLRSGAYFALSHRGGERSRRLSACGVGTIIELALTGGETFVLMPSMHSKARARVREREREKESEKFWLCVAVKRGARVRPRRR